MAVLAVIDTASCTPGTISGSSRSPNFFMYLVADLLAHDCPGTAVYVPEVFDIWEWEADCFKFASTNSNTRCKRPGLQATSSLSGAKDALNLD